MYHVFFFLHKLEEARNLSRCTCYVRTKRPGDGDGDGGEKKTKRKLMAGGGDIPIITKPNNERIIPKISKRNHLHKLADTAKGG